MYKHKNGVKISSVCMSTSRVDPKAKANNSARDFRVIQFCSQCIKILSNICIVGINTVTHSAQFTNILQNISRYLHKSLYSGEREGKHNRIISSFLYHKQPLVQTFYFVLHHIMISNDLSNIFSHNMTENCN